MRTGLSCTLSTKKASSKAVSQKLDRQLLEAYSQTRERPPQAEWIPHPHNAEHRWEAHGTHCCQNYRQRPQGQGDIPCNSGGSDQENAHGENVAAFAYDVYEGFQRKEQTVAVAIDLEDAYNRVQFKLLMDLLIQYGVSLTLIRWVAEALLERIVVMQLGN